MVLIVKVVSISLISEAILPTPKGGVYYVSPDFKTVTPVIQNISVANGVALSTDEKYYGLQKQRLIDYIVFN